MFPCFLSKQLEPKKLSPLAIFGWATWTGYICTINSVYLIPRQANVTLFSAKFELRLYHKRADDMTKTMTMYQANELKVAVLHKWPTSTHDCLLSVRNERNKVARCYLVYHTTSVLPIQYIIHTDSTSAIYHTAPLMCTLVSIWLHTLPSTCYLTRYGQSEYNILGKICGDSGRPQRKLKGILYIAIPAFWPSPPMTIPIIMTGDNKICQAG